eukprot:CAMPEP_0204359732 /NCGR_PEP_ID=MMETSP0469-20131031/37479_1 /ASSEMBLY_ACC=CAM_ASM_000384 /TAXON_ID=2969 /ORGANISM="Oxyrrhis marina" /LENGTH=70 /DNA_ID=CAMNT_0051347817 /DNA_START=11 /DNA_END=223 /DNA_ORIENTATION=+
MDDLLGTVVHGSIVALDSRQGGLVDSDSFSGELEVPLSELRCRFRVGDRITFKIEENDRGDLYATGLARA